MSREVNHCQGRMDAYKAAAVLKHPRSGDDELGLLPDPKMIPQPRAFVQAAAVPFFGRPNKELTLPAGPRHKT